MRNLIAVLVGGMLLDGYIVGSIGPVSGTMGEDLGLSAHRQRCSAPRMPAANLPTTMAAVLLTAHGGFEQLQYRTDIPVPQPDSGEVLIKVGATALNNTDINTRVGWYSKAVKSATSSGGHGGFESIDDVDASWSGTAMSFPRIQGAGVCGRVVAVGALVSKNRVGERVIVKNLLRTYVNYRPYECWTLGSECDRGFAQFVVAPARETFAIDCDWTDAELATVLCAYSSAENMLRHAAVGAERVLITGASGGVGLAAVQLAKLRGATVCSPIKGRVGATSRRRPDRRTRSGLGGGARREVGGHRARSGGR